MTRISLAAALVALVAFGAVSLKAAEEQKKGGGRMTVPMTMEQIKERLGEENKMTAEQEKKVQAINDEFAKKMEEVNKKPEVVAALEAMKKAREEGKREGMRELFTKLTEAMGFNQYEEYKKALSVEGALNEQQIAKLFPQRRRGGEGEKAGGEKPPTENK